MKKYIKKVAAVIAVAGIALSATACSNGGKTVASYKGGKISQEQYYNEMKKSQAGQTTLANMIINHVLDQQYGKKVSDKKLINNLTIIRNNMVHSLVPFFNKMA